MRLIALGFPLPMPLATDLTPYLSSGVLIAALTVAGTWLASRNSRAASQQATEAVQEVDQRKVDQEAFDRIVGEWRQLAETAAANGKAATDRAAANEQALRDVKAQLEQAQDDHLQLRAMLVAHARWDRQVVALVRQIDPDFPEPPPITMGDPGPGSGVASPL